MEELVEKFKRSFRYDEGNLYWLVNRGHKKVGDIAGGPTGDGYIYVHLEKKLYGAHRVVFALHHGYIPRMVDHINGNRLDNRIENLRAADDHSNQWNRKLSSNNTSGYKGVSKCNGRYRASIVVNKKHIWLGLHDTAEDAARAYESASLLYRQY